MSTAGLSEGLSSGNSGTVAAAVIVPMVVIIVLVILVIICVIVFVAKWQKAKDPEEKGEPVQKADRNEAVKLLSPSNRNVQRELETLGVQSPPDNAQKAINIFSEIHLPPENSRMSFIEKDMHDLPDMCTHMPDILNHLNNNASNGTSSLQSHYDSTIAHV